MSVENNVFLRLNDLPTPGQWQAAIHASGFDLIIDTDFDMQSFEGFLPCTYKGKAAGFDYYFEELDIDGIPDEELEEIGDRRYLVTLITHSDMREYMSSMIASAVLCSICHGLLAEGEPPFIKDSEAVQWARDCEPDVEKHFE